MGTLQGVPCPWGSASRPPMLLDRGPRPWPSPMAELPCNAPSPVKGGGDVNLSGAAQQTHTNTQLRTVYHPVEAVIREIHTGNVHKLRVLIRKCANVLT